jgi:hypothetical protein
MVEMLCHCGHESTLYIKAICNHGYILAREFLKSTLT